MLLQKLDETKEENDKFHQERVKLEAKVTKKQKEVRTQEKCY